MTFRFIVAILFATTLTAAVTGPVAAVNVVTMSVARYFSAPATVRIVVAVEPHDGNRALRVELDGAPMFRATELALKGASSRRVYDIGFRDVPAGHYVVRATVLSTDSVRGFEIKDLEVLGDGR